MRPCISIRGFVCPSGHPSVLPLALWKTSRKRQFELARRIILLTRACFLLFFSLISFFLLSCFPAFPFFSFSFLPPFPFSFFKFSSFHSPTIFNHHLFYLVKAGAIPARRWSKALHAADRAAAERLLGDPGSFLLHPSSDDSF